MRWQVRFAIAVGCMLLLSGLLIVPAHRESQAPPPDSASSVRPPILLHLWTPTSHPAVVRGNSLSGATPGVSLLDNIVVAGNASAGPQPDHGVYDPRLGYVYVPDYGTNDITVINDSTDTIQATLRGGDDPFSGTYDSRNGFVYIQNSGLSFNMTVVNGTHVLATIDVGHFDHLSSFDPNNGFLYVTNAGSNNVSIINGTSLLLNISTGGGPLYSVFDPADGFDYVMDAGGSEVVILNGTTEVANVSTGSSPYDGVLDTGTGNLYVTESGANRVAVFNGTKILANVSAGSGPEVPAYDPQNGYVYVPNTASGNVTIINGTTVVGTVAVGGDPVEALYAAGDGFVYVVNRLTNLVSVINQTSLVATVALGLNPAWAAYDPVLQRVYVSIYGTGNVSVIGTESSPYGITFNETGLPAGTTWTVGVNATNMSLPTQAITFAEPNGTFSYTIPNLAGYSPLNPSGTVTISGTHVFVSVRFASTYPVTFSESGLPPGTSWGVTVGRNVTSNSTNSLTIPLINGSYSYQLQQVPGYTTNSWSGNLSVAGHNLTVVVDFTIAQYTLTFNESGLANGTLWKVTASGQTLGSTSAEIVYSVANGTYPWSITPIPGYSTRWTGQSSIFGKSAVVAVRFQQVTYDVNFTESGLPFLTAWSVTVDGTVGSSSGTNLSVRAPNGSWAFVVAPVPGYTTNWTGTIHVVGTSVYVPLAFTTAKFGLTFSEVGLSFSTAPLVLPQWSVEVGGILRNATSPQIQFAEPNGSFSYAVSPIPGYSIANATGTATIADLPTVVTITFSVRLYLTTFRETGLPTGTSWGVNVSGQTVSSTNSTVVDSLPNGSSTYSVAPVPGYRTAWAGSILVHGASTTVTIPFVQVEYGLTFDEGGLAPGTGWSVTIGQETRNSTSASITFPLPNGTWAYGVGAVPGYTALGTGDVRIAGASPPAINVTFHPVVQPGPSSPAGPGPLLVPAAILAAVLIAVVGAVLLWRRRRNPPESVGPSDPTPGVEVGEAPGWSNPDEGGWP